MKDVFFAPHFGNLKNHEFYFLLFSYFFEVLSIYRLSIHFVTFSQANKHKFPLLGLLRQIKGKS